MPLIQIDDLVMAHLRECARAGDAYNDTLRALLGLPAAPQVTATAGVSFAAPGALMPLLEAGMLAEGDTVTWIRRRRGELHTATVDRAGCLITADGAVFRTPDICASAIAGHPCKGWPNWRTSTGSTLQELRDQLGAAGLPAPEVRSVTMPREDHER